MRLSKPLSLILALVALSNAPIGHQPADLLQPKNSDNRWLLPNLIPGPNISAHPIAGISLLAPEFQTDAFNIATIPRLPTFLNGQNRQMSGLNVTIKDSLSIFSAQIGIGCVGSSSFVSYSD
ncbi:hypothetical protein GALMADRAFT_143481 [Galerina marginata CBS 339.88]|uniref:Amidase domain-containing protein n=1 Tax=Galerina marginata (strain CBS 339.88) TaxID=685588 RepID=A0A067SNQ8_GALM3|nr:hypothetical protein GALMADRAFT_143481 [Galerina marginata CBS 339.88]